MTDREALKRQAAERAAELIEDGMVIGLGTGSTARHVLEVLAERRQAGALQEVVGVPTSRATERRARELGVPLTTLDERPRIDLTLDGADEIDPRLDLIKGRGGALLWEKIVATASQRLVIVADDHKLVERLGEQVPLPVEVVPFGWRTHLDFIHRLGAEIHLRAAAAGLPVMTDGGHYLLDCQFAEGVRDPVRLERELRGRVGIVETGLFLGLAEAAIIAGADGVRVMHREPAS